MRRIFLPTLLLTFSLFATVSCTKDEVSSPPPPANTTLIKGHLPVANAQQVTVMEDTASNITLSGSDEDNDSLTYSVVTPPSHGALSGSGNTLSYLPSKNYFGSDTFTFKVSDGNSDSTEATVSIQVTAVNDLPPLPSSDLLIEAHEDTELKIQLGVLKDADGEVLTYEMVQTPSHGNLRPDTATNAIFYNPTSNYYGPDSFSFKVKDATGNYALRKGVQAIRQVKITVQSGNDAPVADEQTISLSADEEKTITLTGSDIEGDPLIYLIAKQPLHGTVSAPTTSAPRTCIYRASTNYVGPDAFYFKVRDGSHDSNWARVTIEVTPANHAPVASNSTITVEKSIAKVISLQAVDSDNNPLTYSVVSTPTHGTLSGTGSSRVYTPTTGYLGQDSFSFKANDGKLDSNTAVVSLTVKQLNTPPVARDVSFEVLDYQKTVVPLDVSDADGDALTPSVVSPPQHGTVTKVGSQLYYTPQFGYKGPDEFTYSVSDGKDFSYSAYAYILSRERFCFRNLPSLPKADDVHVIGVNNGGGSPITVKVQDSGKPITLILASYSAVDWKIEVDRGAQIAKVIVAGRDVQNSSVTGVATPLIFQQYSAAGYVWESEAQMAGINDFALMINEFRQQLGKIETSFQGSSASRNYTVPYSISSVRNVYSFYKVSDEECQAICSTFASGPPATYAPQGNAAYLSNQNLTVSYPVSNSASALGIFASKAKRCGKYYFEYKNDLKGARTSSSQRAAIGITSSTITTDPSAPAAPVLFETWNQGDTMGVAMDLDNNTLNISVNGVPTYSTVLPDIAYRVYRPFTFLWQGDAYTANFGGAIPFKYPVPQGFTRGLK